MSSYHLTLKRGKKGQAANQSEYIARRGRYGREKDDLVIAWHGNLPKFANGNPGTFWRAADMFERSNGTAYREFTLTLPRELNKLQHLTILDKFIQADIGNKPFQIAIHEPISSISGVDHPHAHIMVSDRKSEDGIERSADQYFKRYNSKNPELGGAKKLNGASSRTELREALKATRATWAAIQNAELERSGHDARVDSRSHKERGIKNPPEKYLGRLAIEKMSTEDKMLHDKGRTKVINGSGSTYHKWNTINVRY